VIDRGHSTRPADDDDGSPAPPAEVVTTGSRRPTFFVLLTCGFMVCMCCLAGSLMTVWLGFARHHNLEAAGQAMDAPAGWDVDDSTVRPWGLHATLSGPPDPASLADWLTDLGEPTTEGTARNCLRDADGCTVAFDYHGFTASVTYRGGSERGTATVSLT
jgi:hypothetical protein